MRGLKSVRSREDGMWIQLGLVCLFFWVFFYLGNCRMIENFFGASDEVESGESE